MLIGSVLTLARQKVQANADAGGKWGCVAVWGVWGYWDAEVDETRRELQFLSSQGS